MVKKEQVELEGEKFMIKKGALKRQLGVPQSYTFKRAELNKMKKLEVGDSFEFNGKTRKMTGLLKKRVTLALVLMRGSK
jgi:hypothetical protein